MHEIVARLDVQDPVRRCLALCIECHAICERCIPHCLEMGDEHAGREHQTTMRDCAQICGTAADFMIRSSELMHGVCGVCADACDRCAESCGRLASGDPMMEVRAEMCRQCADACREMSRPAVAIS
jgi:hypothetical protein